LRVDGLEVHIVNADVADAAVAGLAMPAVNQIDQRIAYALDCGYVQLHRAAARIEAPCAQLDGALVGFGRVVHPERSRTDGWTVQARKTLAERVRLGVDQKVDAALAVQRDILVAMAGDGLEAQRF